MNTNHFKHNLKTIGIPAKVVGDNSINAFVRGKYYEREV